MIHHPDCNACRVWWWYCSLLINNWTFHMAGFCSIKDLLLQSLVVSYSHRISVATHDLIFIFMVYVTVVTWLRVSMVGIGVASLVLLCAGTADKWVKSWRTSDQTPASVWQTNTLPVGHFAKLCKHAQQMWSLWRDFCPQSTPLFLCSHGSLSSTLTLNRNTIVCFNKLLLAVKPTQLT